MARTRRGGGALQLRGGLATLLAAVASQPACGNVTHDAPDDSTGGALPDTTGGTGGLEASTGGAIDNGTGGTSAYCEPTSPALAAQAVPFPSGAPRIFYSWTTAEQVAELRAGGPLFSRSERTDLGRGNAMTALAAYAANHVDASGDLARLIDETLFTQIRYAWTNTWAAHLGWPGESYGDQLLRIELEPGAWIVQFDGQYLAVLDVDGQEIAIEQALTEPGRIGAMFFLRGEGAGGPYCGTFFEGNGGYREFVLGNPSMVRSWWLGTTDLLASLDADIAALDALRSSVTDCTMPTYDESWNAEVVCGWTYAPTGRDYEDALSMPSELYYPTPDRLQSLIDSLTAARFEPDPFGVEYPDGIR